MFSLSPALTPPLADGYGDGLWFREQASTFAESSDSLFWLITWISVAFFVPMMIGMAWFMWRYRHTPAETFDSPAPDHNLPLELTWTVIPTLLVVVIFGFGFTGYLDQRTPPADAYEVRVVAAKWNFQFVYPDAGGFISDKLYVPVGRPVRLRMVSSDVLHSFYVPAFRAKWDIVPGRDSVIWFDCTKPGEYLYECTEYCGRGHSTMIGPKNEAGVHRGVIALPLDEFEARLEAERQQSIIEIGNDPIGGGERLYVERGCKACHSVDGANLACPTWKGLYGTTREFTDGTSGVADGAYIRESIIDPGAHVVKGYSNVMPSYKGRLEELEIEALIAYIRTLSDEGQAYLKENPVPRPEDDDENADDAAE